MTHEMEEAKRLGLELNMIAASSWNAGGSWVKKSDGSKRIASTGVDVTGPQTFDEVRPLPCDKNAYYFDISVMAVPQSKDKAPNLVPPRRSDPNIKPIYAMDKCLHCGKPVAVNFRTLVQPGRIRSVCRCLQSCSQRARISWG